MNIVADWNISAGTPKSLNITTWSMMVLNRWRSSPTASDDHEHAGRSAMDIKATFLSTHAYDERTPSKLVCATGIRCVCFVGGNVLTVAYWVPGVIQYTKYKGYGPASVSFFPQLPA